MTCHLTMSRKTWYAEIIRDKWAHIVSHASMQDGGTAPLSFVSSYLEEKGGATAEDLELIKAAAASLYSGRFRLR